MESENETKSLVKKDSSDSVATSTESRISSLEILKAFKRTWKLAAFCLILIISYLFLHSIPTVPEPLLHFTLTGDLVISPFEIW